MEAKGSLGVANPVFVFLTYIKNSACMAEGL